VPGSEAVETAEGEPISNTENNLVARRQAQQASSTRTTTNASPNVIAAMPAARAQGDGLEMAASSRPTTRVSTS